MEADTNARLIGPVKTRRTIRNRQFDLILIFNNFPGRKSLEFDASPGRQRIRTP